MVNVLYLHNFTQISGGERSLLALWENLDRAKFRPFLAVPGEGSLTEKARKLGVECLIWSVPALRPWIRSERPASDASSPSVCDSIWSSEAASSGASVTSLSAGRPAMRCVPSL